MNLTSDSLRLAALLKAGGLPEFLADCAGAGRYQVLTFDETHQVLTPALGWPPDWCPPNIPLEGPLARWFEASPAEMLSAAAPAEAGDTDWVEAAQAELRGLRAEWAFPLRAGRKFIGVLLVSGPPGQPITAPAARSVRLLCRQLGEALAFRSAGKTQELLGSSSSGLAHDLKNWLTPVRTCLQLWAAGGPDAVKAEALRPTALRNLEIIQACLEQARYYSQHHHPRFQLKPLTPILRRAVALAESFTSGKPATVTVRGDEGLAAEVDELLWLRLLNNLLLNAIQAAPSGAAIALELEPLASPAGWLRLRVINPAAAGEGGPTTNEFAQKRWGLGLQICREIVAQHGGRITIGPAPDAHAIVAQVDWPARRARPAG